MRRFQGGYPFGDQVPHCMLRVDRGARKVSSSVWGDGMVHERQRIIGHVRATGWRGSSERSQAPKFSSRFGGRPRRQPTKGVR